MISTESKAPSVGPIKAALESGNYSRALDLLRAATAEFRDDPDVAELQKRAEDGLKRKSEADRLITESQELFAQQKSAEALDLLRKAHELDKRNSLARAILANALVEHAQSVVETDWLKAETLTNQALAVNPAHPTAKTVLNQIVDRKTKSSVDDWVAQSRKLQSSGDLFGALAWVAEGLAVHPNDAKLIQIQDEIQRDQGARKRQARRGDLDDLRRLEREIAGAKEPAAKQALAERIQAVAAKYWTDGEIISIANALLLRLGLVSQESSGPSSRSKGATLILHVPRPNAAKAPNVETSEVSPVPTAANVVVPVLVPPSQVSAGPVPPAEVQPEQSLPIPGPVSTAPVTSIAESAKVETVVSKAVVPPRVAPTNKTVPSKVGVKVESNKISGTVAPPQKIPATPAQQSAPPLTVAVSTEPSKPSAKVIAAPKSTEQPAKSKFAVAFLVVAAAIVAVAVTFFFTRRHYDQAVANTSALAPPVSAPPTNSAAMPTAAAPIAATPSPATPAVNPPTESSSEPPPVTSSVRSETAVSVPDEQPPTQPNNNVGALLIVAGQDGATVSLNGKVQRQLTRAGQFSLPNLQPKDYMVQVSKSGFQNPPQQTVRIRKGETAKLVFDLQPQPRLASLSVQGAAPGTTVLVDQTAVGTVQPDGTLSVQTVNPGDHTIELRKDRFKPRQFKKTFVAGGTVSLATADTTLEVAPSQLKITFTPADASVALVKGDLLKMVSSGTTLTLAPGTYTLTARTAERFTRTAIVEIVAGQLKNLDLSLAPNGMSKFQDPGAWKAEGTSFTRKGGDFALYGVVPTSGTVVFSALPAKGHNVQWVLNYTDSRNYVLFQVDENNFYRSVIRNGEKGDEVIIPHKLDKKALRSLQIRVSSTEIVHQIKQGETWRFLDRWTQPGVNLSQGKFGFYIPGNDQVTISNFAHYADLNTR